MIWPFKKRAPEIVVEQEGRTVDPMLGSHILISAEDPNKTIPVIPADQTKDPFVFALMRALEGHDAHIYQGTDGFWRDAETDEAIDNLNQETP